MRINLKQMITDVVSELQKELVILGISQRTGRAETLQEHQYASIATSQGIMPNNVLALIKDQIT